MRLGLTVLLVMLGADVSAQTPRIMHFVSPSYPPLARQAMISGQVGLKLTVDTGGTVSEISIESEGYRLLGEASKAVVQTWMFDSAPRSRTLFVELYYGFAGTPRECDPLTTVQADFAGFVIRVFVTSNPRPPTHASEEKACERGNGELRTLPVPLAVERVQARASGPPARKRRPARLENCWDGR